MNKARLTMIRAEVVEDVYLFMLETISNFDFKLKDLNTQLDEVSPDDMFKEKACRYSIEELTLKKRLWKEVSVELLDKLL